MNSHLHVAITDEELSEWADKRADDAGRLARELIASRNGQKVPQDVTKLVIAARVVAFEDQSREAIRALDIASEAFADRVPWDGEPALSPPAVPGEVRAQLDLIKHLAEYTTEKNWADNRLYIMQAVDRALSAPLLNVEGGDKGDGWKWVLVPDYPEGNVVGPCICGSWPGGPCLKCPPSPASIEGEKP